MLFTGGDSEDPVPGCLGLWGYDSKLSPEKPVHQRTLADVWLADQGYVPALVVRRYAGQIDDLVLHGFLVSLSQHAHLTDGLFHPHQHCPGDDGKPDRNL